MSSNQRHHVIHSVVRDGGSLIGVLEKDWYEAEFCDRFWHHFRVSRGNHIFHVTTEWQPMTQRHAENMVTACLAGNVISFDLQQLSMTDFMSKKGE